MVSSSRLVVRRDGAFVLASGSSPFVNVVIVECWKVYSLVGHTIVSVLSPSYIRLEKIIVMLVFFIQCLASESLRRASRPLSLLVFSS